MNQQNNRLIINDPKIRIQIKQLTNPVGIWQVDRRLLCNRTPAELDNDSAQLSLTRRVFYTSIHSQSVELNYIQSN